MEINSLGIPVSAICDLNCDYCFINKNKTLKQIQNNNKIKINTYLEDEKIVKYVSLGIAETTLVAKDFVGLLNKFKFDEISLITNLNNIDNLLYFLDHTNAKKIMIIVSLDGFYKIHYRHRGKSNFKNLIKNLKTLSKINKRNLVIGIGSTNDMKDIKFLLEKNNLEIQKRFFDSIKRIFNGNINIDWGLHLVKPGFFTKEDGLIFAKYIKKLKLSKIKFLNFRVPCSEGDYKLTLDFDLTWNWCENSVFSNYYTNKTILSEFRDEYNFERNQVIIKSFFNNPLLVYNLIYSNILLLAKSNQISSIYNNNYEAKKLAIYLYKYTCWLDNFNSRGSVFINTVEYIKLWGNGAFKEIDNVQSI